MRQAIEQIKTWSKAFSLPTNDMFTIPSKNEFEQHCSHILEESKELLTAFKDGDTIGILDGVGDTVWVTIRLNLLLGIPAHLFVEKDYKYYGDIDFNELDVHYVENSIKIIHKRLATAIEWGQIVIEFGDEYAMDLEAMLWSLNRYVISLINYLQVDIDKLINIIYDSNMSKLCSYSEAEESCKILAEKGIEVRPYLSPIWSTLPRVVGEQPKKYYIAEESGRIRKPVNFVEPQLELYYR